MNISDEKALYSKIIQAKDYIRTVSKEHIYISSADRHLIRKMNELAENKPLHCEIVELGCGPGRIFSLLHNIKNVRFTGIEHDHNFVDYAKENIQNSHIDVIHADIITYIHPYPVNIFYSMGVHHHIPKGELTQLYLTHVFNQLEKGGYYLLADEFIPNYDSEDEREILLVIWYAHVITHALKNGYNYLAEEETKTLLDDIYTGRANHSIKTSQQIELVLSQVQSINSAAEIQEMTIAYTLASKLIQELNKKVNFKPQNENTDLSRGDYKICDHVFRKEVETAGFIVSEIKSIGPVEHIGGMSIYTLKKP